MRRTENGCLVPVDSLIFNIGRLGTPCLPQKRASGRDICETSMLASTETGRSCV